MYSFFSDRSINKLFYKILDASLDWPRGVVRRDGRLTIDSPGPVCVCLTNPRNKVLSIPGRVACFPATCAETLWVLGGRNDIGLIKYFLPRAVDFCDDGVKWRAGYGPRLRGEYMGFPDQLSLAIQELDKDNSTRRSVITLFDPEKDYLALKEGTKDFPCTQSLSFMVREGKLDLTVFIRSNDFIWGWSHINVFEFCVLQELVSNITQIPLGQFYVISNSLHIYEDLAKRIQAINSKERFDVYDYCHAAVPKRPSTLADTDELIEVALGALDRARLGKNVEFEWMCRTVPLLVTDLAIASLVFTFAHDIRAVFNALALVEDEAFRVALLEWVVRTKGNHPSVTEFLKNSSSESISRYILQEN